MTLFIPSVRAARLYVANAAFPTQFLPLCDIFLRTARVFGRKCNIFKGTKIDFHFSLNVISSIDG